uniref:Uncharacterized protein n=1 Tax=Oryza punctata TaxID=4537 RepID=A0A0E0L0A4_ORYPU
MCQQRPRPHRPVFSTAAPPLFHPCR